MCRVQLSHLKPEMILQAVYIQSVGVTGDEKLNFYLMESIYAFHAFEVSLAIR